MLYTERKNLTAIQIKEALLPKNELLYPLEELISTGEAVFEFIRQSEMDLNLKNAFFRLEKQLDLYKNLLLT